MWYSRIIESATAWDVLSTKEVNWSGSFSRTFQDFSFYDVNRMPTMTAMLKFLAEIEKGRNNDSILSKYFEKSKTDYNIMADVINFSDNMSKFIDSQMKKQANTANTDMLKLFDFLGTINSFTKSQGQRGNTLGGDVPDAENAKSYVNATLGIGYTTLNLLIRKGTELSDSIALFIIRGEDKSLLGVPDSEQRDLLISQLKEKKPELSLFEDYQTAIKTIWTAGIKQYIPQLQDFLYSGIDPPNLLHIIIQLLNQGDIPQDKIAEMIVRLPIEALIDILNYMEYHGFDKFSISLANNLYNSISEYNFKNKPSLIAKLKKNKSFIDLINSKGDQCIPLFIFKGFAQPQVIISYLERNPEDYDKFSSDILDSLGAKIKSAIVSKGQTAQAKIQSDGLALLEKAAQKGVVTITKASDTSFNYAYGKGNKNQVVPESMSESEKRQKGKSDEIFGKLYQSYEDRMNQEAPFAGVSEEDIKTYADQMIIIEFSTSMLERFMIENNAPKMKIGPVDMIDEKWGGLFVPRFPTKDRGTVPAILIKTDIWNQLSYHQALAQNINMSDQNYVEATRRHEVAHALQYLQSGDLMMEDSIALNPELTPEEAYISNPSELYARIHGDIPYLSKIFDAHIGNLMSDRKIYESAKEQWILDIQDEMVHLMSGGTNASRLLADMEAGRFGTFTTDSGQTINLTDPLEAINKKLQRQRNRLEMIFHETFQIQGRRDYRRGLIGKKNQLMQQIQSAPIYSPERTHLEEELKDVQTQLVESGKMLIFDVKDVSEAVVEGYMSDYYSKIAEAVANGLLTTDIVNPEGEDRRKENEQLREQAKKSQEPPTAQDIRQHSRFQIQQTEPIPSGRKIDVIIPRYKGPGRPPGNFPGFDDAEQDDQQVDITIERDPEKTEPEKTASVFNYRISIKQKVFSKH
jgi:hypothetical protein